MSANFSEVTVEVRPILKGVPHNYYVEYFGTLPLDEEVKFFVARPRENWDYDQFVLYVENLNPENPKFLYRWHTYFCREVVRYRDGGTTKFKTDIGEFFFPSCFTKVADPTFNGDKIAVYERIGEGHS